MIMKLKPRNAGPDEFKEIASSGQVGRGVRVYDRDGNDMGYFGPEEYEKIILGWKAPERDATGDLDHT